MGALETIRNIKPAYAISAVALLVALAAFFAYKSSRPVSTGEDQLVWLKCANPTCDQALQMRYRDAVAGATLDSESPISPGIRCPKCTQNSLASATQCPKDQAIFLTRPPTGKDAKCPTCGWDQAEEARAALRKQLGR